MDEWNGMNNTENNGGMSGLLEGTLSNAMYNVAIGVHLLVGLIVTYFLALRMPYIFPEIYHVHPIIFSIGFLVVGLVGGSIAAKGNYVLSLIGYGMNILAFGTLLSLVTILYPVQYIVLAAVLTTVVVLTMTIAGVIFPNAFLSMGRTILLPCCWEFFIRIFLPSSAFLFSPFMSAMTGREDNGIQVQQAMPALRHCSFIWILSTFSSES